jgi:hypothetical protein
MAGRRSPSWRPDGRGARFNFTVDDPDALWVELKDRVAVIEPLFDTRYETRKFTQSQIPMATNSASSAQRRRKKARSEPLAG